MRMNLRKTGPVLLAFILLLAGCVSKTPDAETGNTVNSYHQISQENPDLHTGYRNARI